MERYWMRLTRRDQQFWVSGLLLLILLLAWGLRLYRIEAQSLWNDEGTSVALAARDLATITKGAANDIHPPLYYYILHFWMVLFGQSELAVRSLSALLGTLLVFLVFVLGRILAGNRTGLLAALFSALSPFQVYYSQETRMYILTAFLGAMSMYAFLRLLSHWQDACTCQSPASVRDWTIAAVYAIATILLLYTHYLAGALIVVQNLALLWSLKRSQSPVTSNRVPAILRWAVLQTIILVAYLPWLFLARAQLRVWPAISEPLRLTTMTLDLLRVFSLGLSVEPRPSLWLLGFAVLLLMGVLAPLLNQKETMPGRIPASTPHVVSILYLFVPIAIMYVLSLQRPMYNPKFLLLCMVPFCLLLAQGALYPLSRRARFWPFTRTSLSLPMVFLLAATAFVTVASLYSLRAYYSNPRYARDNYRGIAQYIQAIEGEDDAIVINAPAQIETFAYYYRGKLSLYPLPRQRPLDEDQTEADLRQMVQTRKRIFAVLWATDESDPGRFVEGWLDQHTYKAMDSWYGNVRLVVYAVPAEPAGGGIEHLLSADLGDQVRLLGYNLPTTEVRPGEILQLTLFWQAIAPIDKRYKVFTHVLDAQGHLVGQRDAEPGGGAKITTIWKRGEEVVDNYGLTILPATPPGDYTIEIGMYGLDDGQRLPVVKDAQKDAQAVSDHIVLLSVRVLPALAPPPLSVLGIRKQIDARFQNVMLLGYDLAKLGHEHEPDAPIHPGDVLHLTLFWQANTQPSEDIAVWLRLQDVQGKVWLERRERPTEGLYPSPQWRVNEIVRDQHNLFLPADLPVGLHFLYLSVQRLSNDAQIGPLLTLTSLTIK